MKPFLQLKSVEQVLEIIFNLPILESETVPLEKAASRRLAEDFFSPAALPGFRRSTMDGFAVQARDLFGATESNPALLKVKGTCEMGKIPAFTLAAGEAATILTGAPLPEGADAVIMIEHTREAAPGYIEIMRPLAPGDNLIEADEDAAAGELLIPAGRLIRAQEIGIFAALGVSAVPVGKRPKVAIISTGDEIVPLDAELKPGQMRDVNSWTLSTLCAANGAEIHNMGIICDDPGLLTKTLGTAANIAQIVVVSGGSSAGMRDHTIAAIEALPGAEIKVHGVAISPGKPFILGVSGNICLLGLPGHVSSALVTAHVFLAPLIQHLQGLRKPTPSTWIEATLTRSVASAQGRRDYIRCRLEQVSEGYMAVPLLSSSAVLRGLVEADGLIVCPESAEGLAAGQKVKVHPL